MVYHGGMASPPPSDGLVPASSPTLPSSPPSRISRKEKKKSILTPRKFRRFFTPRGMPSQISRERPALGELRSLALNAQTTPPRSTPRFNEPISPTSNHSSSLLSPFGSEDGPRKRKRSVVNAIPMKLPPSSRNSNTKRSRTQLEDLNEDYPLGRSPVARSPLEQNENAGLEDHPMGSPSPSGSHTAVLGRTYPTGPQATSDEFARRLSSLTASNFANAGYEGLRPRSTLIDYFKCNRAGIPASSRGKAIAAIAKLPLPPKDEPVVSEYRPLPVIKLRNRGFGAQLLLREQGSTPRPGREHLEYPAFDSRASTASFWSRSTDVHMCNAHLTQANTIPFSLASCHNAPMTAIGDEEGFIRFFDTTTTPLGATPRTKVEIVIQAHENAIMDLAFSNDDLRLASACGDRSGKIFDVMSQTVAVELNGGHFQSMRRVEFQPGKANGNVVATSDRDGKIQIWDLRCSMAPAAAFSTRGPEGIVHRDRNRGPLWARTTNTLDNAHARTVESVTSPASVTALQYMPEGREHLLLSASEANACIKLWDTRYITPRNKEAAPLAVTAEPGTHRWRPYGLTSLALSSDAARLYAVCKDNTVYAYSTSHLMLGHAPELSLRPPRQKAGSAVQGLSPLYGFKHDLFHVKSFYVRGALRPVSTSGTELLAVGSTDKCAIIFPTDERAMREYWDMQSHLLPSETMSTSSSAATSSFHSKNLNAGGAQVPIIRNGTPLVRGHRREVTGLSWSNEGKLVTISDDYMVRHWQESNDSRDAWDLRTGGEFGGKRHLAGWADVADDWDEDCDSHSEC
ncbi:WD domain-containing protein [Colletotrichum orchidophilum]|uniref:WD domain-containing protein n=1 Tax=Colletotrichum orchidophilum TaxID=1209926 RepID=A0A1G4B3F7_9PEZI|nr:WD domain-containing protein [Colletotrichum orchidophilum]OHE95924.1 WD domain-containing protein [Colletotrichum orchidophilum]